MCSPCSSGLAEVRWLEQTSADVPAGEDWLSDREVRVVAGLRVPKRRADWRLGRWTAKLAVAECCGVETDCVVLRQIEILAAPGGAPEAFIDDKRAALTVSLSHSRGRCVCAVAPAEVTLGCDIERIEARSEAFARDYLACGELQALARVHPAERDVALTLFWSAKESALKALRTGLRLDTREVVVEIPLQMGSEGRWHPLRVSHRGRSFDGWWRHARGFVTTVEASPSPLRPIESRIGPVSGAELAAVR